MRVVALAPRQPSVVRDALVERGVDPVRAEATARGLAPTALLVDDLPTDRRDLLARAAAGHGIECLTGEGWALLAGATARLAALARPGGDRPLPDELAADIGRLLQHGLDPGQTWEMARGAVSLERPVVVGILNVTPDSFSDGGRFLRADAALCHAAELVEGGADILDIGAESTRPGRAAPVPADTEWRRLEPVLIGLRERFPSVPISVDTAKAETACRALAAGAWAINDVSGLRLNPTIADACAEYGAGLILMHSRGDLGGMASYRHARYRDLLGEVLDALRAAAAQARDRGVRDSSIVLDPGLGFAKRPEHNRVLLNRLPALAALGYPVMVGPSRKRFLGEITGKDVGDRDVATAAACVAAHALGATLFRVHAAGIVAEALQVAHAIRTS